MAPSTISSACLRTPSFRPKLIAKPTRANPRTATNAADVCFESALIVPTSTHSSRAILYKGSRLSVPAASPLESGRPRRLDLHPAGLERRLKALAGLGPRPDLARRAPPRRRRLRKRLRWARPG